MEKPKVSLNGGLAYREGATIDDNPFDFKTDQMQWSIWWKQFKDEQDRRVGKAK